MYPQVISEETNEDKNTGFVVLAEMQRPPSTSLRPGFAVQERLLRMIKAYLSGKVFSVSPWRRTYRVACAGTCFIPGRSHQINPPVAIRQRATNCVPVMIPPNTS